MDNAIKRLHEPFTTSKIVCSEDCLVRILVPLLTNEQTIEQKFAQTIGHPLLCIEFDHMILRLRILRFYSP